MKKALGGRAYKNYWLLRPSVVRHLVSYASRFGTGTSDVLHEKTNLLGGTLVLSKEGKILLTTIQENAPMLDRLLGVKPRRFAPSIPHLVYQYALYTNYESDQLAELNPEIPVWD